MNELQYFSGIKSLPFTFDSSPLLQVPKIDSTLKNYFGEASTRQADEGVETENFLLLEKLKRRVSMPI